MCQWHPQLLDVDAVASLQLSACTGPRYFAIRCIKVNSKGRHYATPLQLCIRDEEFYHSHEGGLCCGNILLKSGADPTFSDEIGLPPVLSAMMDNPVSIHVCPHLSYYIKS